MSAAKKVVITVEPDGSTTIDAQGFADNSCAMATKQLEAILVGTGEVKRDPKPDFFVSADLGVGVRTGR